ncbi:MAG: alpha/beta hydrolase [Pseudomonadota bacterium]
MSIPGFSAHVEPLNGTEIAWSMGGSGPPLLLLHGFPQTRALWARLSPELARTHTVICPDLRGYGASAKPDAVAAYSFRQMARDQIALLDHLHLGPVAVAGHDRGARVAHRMALDHPEAVSRLVLMDVVPTHTLLSDLSQDVARAYYHWFFLAQPAPLPERLIGSDRDLYFESCLNGWGRAGLSQFDPQQLAAYRQAWSDPDTIRGMCNDYRATLEHDQHIDAADLGTKISCPTLILFGADGVMGQLYDIPACWAAVCTHMTDLAVPGGHFFVDTHPAETLHALTGFLDT